MRFGDLRWPSPHSSMRHFESEWHRPSPQTESLPATSDAAHNGKTFFRKSQEDGACQTLFCFRFRHGCFHRSRWNTGGRCIARGKPCVVMFLTNSTAEEGFSAIAFTTSFVARFFWHFPTAPFFEVNITKTLGPIGTFAFFHTAFFDFSSHFDSPWFLFLTVFPVLPVLLFLHLPEFPLPTFLACHL